MNKLRKTESGEEEKAGDKELEKIEGKKKKRRNKEHQI